jgi:Fe-S oxidoreductase
MHITELVAKRLREDSALLDVVPENVPEDMKDVKEVVSFQDPCRLRNLDVIEAPREVLKRIPGLELREMEHSGFDALCCGTSSWMNCTGDNKRAQMGRIGEALKMGASTLVTACPKCQIHFKCAMRAPGPASTEKPAIEVRDIVTVLAQTVGRATHA